MIELWIRLRLFPIRWIVYYSYEGDSWYYVANIFRGISGYFEARRYIREAKND